MHAVPAVSGFGSPKAQPTPNYIEHKPQDSADIIVGGAGYEVKVRPIVILQSKSRFPRHTDSYQSLSRLLTHTHLSYVYE